MAYLHKPVEEMTERELSECVGNPRVLQAVRDQAAARLADIRAQHDKIFRSQDAHLRRLKAKARAKAGTKVYTVQESVTHSARNGLGLGGIVAAWATYKEYREVAVEMAGEAAGIAGYAVQIMKRLHLSPAEIVYIVSAAGIGFLLTLAWKITRVHS